jgi:hypothetical protein
MDSCTGSPAYSDYNPPLYQQQSGQNLPPIYNLELPPPGAIQAPRDPGRRPRASHKPHAEQANIWYNGSRLWTYYIENLPYAMEKPANEDYNDTYRQTFDGRTLKYTLTVLQQPERARACGAGARCESRNLAIILPPFQLLISHSFSRPPSCRSSPRHRTPCIRGPRAGYKRLD